MAKLDKFLLLKKSPILAPAQHLRLELLLSCPKNMCARSDEFVSRMDHFAMRVFLKEGASPVFDRGEATGEVGKVSSY